ncbi:MAG: ribbon-helix-helix protein, CopG family [Candidatus Electrothrix scaldis]|nr:MAG: ribbon-helix-helix protein, CopG family [Candidatus Electrothrix sp. GW3-3]
MSGIKTAISLDEHLFNEVKETARDLNTSRSGVIRQALLEFMERRRNQRLLDQLNAVYKDEPTEEEENIVRSMRNVQQGITEQEPW